MSDDHEPEAGDQGAKEYDLTATAIEDQNDRSNDVPERGGGPSDREHRRALRFLRELNTNERLTAFLALSSLVVAVGSLGAAVVSCQNAADTTEIQKAIGSLTSLAKSTNAEADAMRDQLRHMNDEVAEMRRQADATAALIGPAQESAGAAVKGLAMQERHFQLGERPILDEAPLPPGPIVGPHFDPSTGGRLAWSYSIQNYGKTTALNIQERRLIKLGEAPFLGNGSGWYPSPSIAPSRGTWATVFYPSPISPAMRERMEKTYIPITVRVRLRYEDASGNRYRGEVCLLRNPNGSIRDCRGMYREDSDDKLR